MSDSKRYDEVQRGDMAKALLESPLMQDVLNDIEQAVLSAWELTGPRDVEAREKAWAFYLASKKFRSTLTSYIETGLMAKVQLEDQRKRFQLFNRGN